MILVMIGMILCTAIFISKIGATNSLKHVYPLGDALDEMQGAWLRHQVHQPHFCMFKSYFWCYTLNNKV